MSKFTKKLLLLLSLFVFFEKKSDACEPVTALGIPDWGVSADGNTLYIDFVSYTAFACTFETRIELICNSANFSGNANHVTATIIKGSGVGSMTAYNDPVAYPRIEIDISQYCPGTILKWRAREFSTAPYTNGGPYTSTFSFTVPGTLDPLETTISTAPTSICPGQSVNLSGSATGNCGNLTYAWSNGATGTGTTVSPATTTTYTLTATDAMDACGQRTASDNVTVTVMPVPAAAFTSTSVCAGIATQLTDQSTVGNPSSIAQWEWDIGNNGTVDYTTQNPTHTFPGPGTYNVRLRVESDFGCHHTTTGTVTVHPNPVANFTSSTVCEGNATAFTNTSTVSSGSITGWSWDFDDGNTSTAQSPNHTYDDAGTYTVELTVTTNNNCTHDVSHTVQVYSNPDVDFTFTDDLCDGTAAEFTDTSTDDDGTVNGWSWNFGDGNTSTAQNPSHTYDGPGTYTVTLQATTSNTCPETNSHTITILEDPIAAFSSDTVCGGNLTQLFDESTVDPPSTIASWDWDIGNNGTVDYTTQNPSHDFEEGGTYDVSLTVTSNLGCSTTVVGQIEVYAQPEAEFTVTTECNQDPTVFSDQSMTDIGVVSEWAWTFGDGNTSTNQNPSHTYNNPGNYTATLHITTDNGCTDEISYPVTVHPLPVPNFSFAEVCDGNDVDFNNQSTIITGTIASYSWNFGDGNSSTDEHPTHQYSTAGTYTVTLIATSEYDCSESISQDITVYPMPTANFNSTTVCANQVTQLTDQSTVAAPSNITTWLWDIENNGLNNYFNQNPNHTFPVGGTYDVKLYIETEFGCSDEIVLQVDVHPVPVADFSVPNVCLGETNEFTDLSEVASGIIASWDWNFGDGNSSTQQNPSHIYGDIGFYTVTLLVTTDQGCTHQTSSQVEIYTSPTPNFVALEDCFYDPIAFTDATSGIITNWEWDFGDGGSSTNQNPTHTFSNPGVYDVTLTVSTQLGCEGTATYQVEAFPKPVANFSFTEVCLNEETVVTDISTVVSTGSAANIVGQIWNMGDGNNYLNEPTVNHIYDNEGNYNVTLITSTNHGCLDTITQQLTVYPLPNVNFTQTDACLFEETQFTDQSTISNQFSQNTLSSWFWDFGDGGATSSSQHPSYTFSSDGTFSTTLTVTSNRGCVNSVTRNVTVHPLPVVNFASLDTVGCSPICASFVNVSTISLGTISSVIWDFGDGTTQTAAPNDAVSNCYENETQNLMMFDVELTVISGNGCESSFTKPNNVQVFPIPEADFVPTPQPTSVHASDIKFINTSIGGVAFDWDFGGQGSSTEEHPSFWFSPDFEGTYPVELIITNVYGCRDTIIKYVEIEGEFIIYVPNAFTPNGDGVNDFFGPVIQGYDEREFSFFIFNRWGELIFEAYHPDRQWDGNHKGITAKTDVYVWKISVRDKYTNEIKDFIGHVTLLR
jgi:gliding motility-associated-like protein